MIDLYSDETFMKQALKEAASAFDLDEVPVGAVIVCNNTIVARAHNMTERLNDVTAHAEMQAITAAADYLGAKYLNECTLFVTVEPCLMCAGALYWSQIGRIVFGARDDKRGFSNLDKPILHPTTDVEGGVLEDLCVELIRSFFQKKR